MTEHGSPDAPRHDLAASGWAPAAPAGQDLTSLLDLHRRGVIDDAQFAELSRSLTGTTAAPDRAAALAAAPARRRAAGRLSRRSTAAVAGAAVLVLAAAGISWAVLPDTARSSVDLASLDGAAERSVGESDSAPTAGSATTPTPSSSAAAGSSATDATPSADSQAPISRETATQRASTPPAPPVALPPAPAPAVVAPPAPAAEVAPAPAPPRVDCSAYVYAKESNRVMYESQLHNTNIDFNIALNTGNLDEAARLQGAAQAIEQQWSLDDSRLAAQHPGC